MSITVRGLKALLDEFGDDMPVVFVADYDDMDEKEHSIHNVNEGYSAEVGREAVKLTG